MTGRTPLVSPRDARTSNAGAESTGGHPIPSGKKRENSCASGSSVSAVALAVWNAQIRMNKCRRQAVEPGANNNARILKKEAARSTDGSCDLVGSPARPRAGSGSWVMIPLVCAGIACSTTSVKAECSGCPSGEYCEYGNVWDSWCVSFQPRQQHVILRALSLLVPRFDSCSVTVVRSSLSFVLFAACQRGLPAFSLLLLRIANIAG